MDAGYINEKELEKVVIKTKKRVIKMEDGSGYEYDFKQFVADMRLAGFSGRTVESYIYYNLKFLNFVKKSPRGVSSRDIKGFLLYLIDKGKKPRTINLVYSSLKQYYDVFMGRKLFYGTRRMRIYRKCLAINT